LLGDKINAMDDESYAQYLKYHLYACEKPELLGHSNHIMFVGKGKHTLMVVDTEKFMSRL